MLKNENPCRKSFWANFAKWKILLLANKRFKVCTTLNDIMGCTFFAESLPHKLMYPTRRFKIKLDFFAKYLGKNDSPLLETKINHPSTKRQTFNLQDESRHTMVNLNIFQNHITGFWYNAILIRTLKISVSQYTVNRVLCLYSTTVLVYLCMIIILHVCPFLLSSGEYRLYLSLYIFFPGGGVRQYDQAYYYLKLIFSFQGVLNKTLRLNKLVIIINLFI